MGWMSSFLMLIGRLLLGGLFIFSFYGKVMEYDTTAAYMATKGLPFIPLLLGLAIVIELVGGLSLIFGYKIRAMALLLFLYLIPVTFFIHDFWNAQAPNDRIELINFIKNLGIMGGLLYVAATGAGFLGCDRCNHNHVCKVEAPK